MSAKQTTTESHQLRLITSGGCLVSGKPSVVVASPEPSVTLRRGGEHSSNVTKKRIE